MWISKTSHTAGGSANEYNLLEKFHVGKFQPGGRFESLTLSTSIPKYFPEKNLEHVHQVGDPRRFVMALRANHQEGL